MAEKKKTTARKPRSKAKKKQKTYIALVIDKSSSMQSVYQAALTGLNEQIQTIKNNAKKGGETYVTLVQFADYAQVVYDQKPAKELQPLTMAEYQPNGWTAMRDGIYMAIQSLKKVCTCDEHDDTAFLVVVISDGEENRSRFISQFNLAEEIKLLEATGKWTFTYMLSNVDVKKYAQDYNIHWGNVSTFTSNNIGTQDAFLRSANSTAKYMTSRTAGVSSVQNFYNADNTVTLDPTKLTPTTVTLINSNGAITVVPDPVKKDDK